MLVVFATRLYAQHPEAAITKLDATRRLLKIDSYRQLDSLATVLANAYQLHINAEDPPFACSDGILTVKPDKRNPLSALAPGDSYLLKGGTLEVKFEVNRNRKLLEPVALLRQAIATYNRQFAFKYTLLRSADVYTFVPVEGRDDHCQLRNRNFTRQEDIVPAAAAALETVRLLRTLWGPELAK